MLQGSSDLPELLADNTFFTPDTIKIPADVLSHTDENQLRITFGSSIVHRTGAGPQSRIVTLPSIREEDFRRTLLQRTLRDTDISSTPLRPLESIVSNERALITVQNEANDGSTELAGEQIRPLQLEARGGPHSIAEIFEVVESIVTNTETNIFQQPVVETTSNEVVIPADLPPRNWFDVLRKRNTDLHYVDVVPQRRKKRHHIAIRPTATRLVENIRDEIDANIRILQAQLPIGDSVCIGPTEVHAECNMTKDLTHDSNQVEKKQQGIMQQPSHERFVFEHIESISTIMDNLTEWKRLLETCNQDIGYTSSAAFSSSSYAYDVNTLLDTDVEVLQIKMNILQEIIRNVSFSITKKSLIRNKRLAAVAFNFLVELQAAGIIRMNDNGHFVGLI